MDSTAFGGAAGVGFGQPTAFELALAAHEATLDDLIKLAGDGALADHDDLGLVEAMRRYERIRNRSALVDHCFVGDAQARSLPEHLAQPHLTAVLADALWISHADAARRVRAADQLSERVTLTGQPLPPLRPALAEAQRSDETSPEQVDIVLRAIAKVDHRGFDPADLDAADRLLAGHTTRFGPQELRDLAARIVERIDSDGTRPRDELNHDRRHLALRQTSDGTWNVEGR